MKLNIDPSFFNAVYMKYQFNNQSRYQIYFGGAASGKSVSLAQRCVLDVLSGRNYLIVRNIERTLKTSCFNEVLKQIKAFKVTKYFDVNKTDLTITCSYNNRQIIFRGLDDPEKIKSVTTAYGVITDIWVEEATECDYAAIKQLDKRLRGLSEFAKRLTLSFNPILREHWIYREYFGIWTDDSKYVCKNNVSILKTIYKDNCFLAKEDIEALENETDPYYKDVYTYGNWGVLGNTIFNNIAVKDLSNMSFDTYVNGHDFGYNKDPDAFVRMHYDRKRKQLYIVNEIYESGLLIDELARKILKIASREIVVCDCEDPRSIAELCRQGVMAVPAKKGPGSVLFGIKWLKSQNIIIDIRCQNAVNEFKKYRWKTDKYGTALPMPVDKDNHLIDAVRYGCEHFMDHQTAIVQSLRVFDID